MIKENIKGYLLAFTTVLIQGMTYIFLNEEITFFMFLGGILILFGIYIAKRRDYIMIQKFKSLN